MDWIDRGIVLTARKHGETSLIVSLLTEHHGRHVGLVRGGAGRRNRGIYQPGNLVNAQWRARLPEHLGTYTCELMEAKTASFLDSPLELAALQSAAALSETSLPEREQHPNIFNGLLVVLESLQDPSVWPAVYIKWELGLLKELGFGLDFSSCAASGKTDDLVYVSPKTGRAVSRQAGEPYKDIVLNLPEFLVDNTVPCELHGLSEGLKLSGYFLERHAFGGLALPPARDRFADRVRQYLKNRSEL
jgi:DNA repair protein RecO (recombination protein O)